MNTYSNRALFFASIVAGSLSLMSTDLIPGTDPTVAPVPSLCTSVPTRMPLPERNPGALTGVAGAIAAAPEAYITGLLAALGQSIVEAELSHAAASGRFEPVISAMVAGSTFQLEVCSDTIVGEIDIANQPRLRFVIGDFDGDGATDVAVQRPDSRSWSVDLGALRRTTVGLGTPVQLRLIEATKAGADGAAPARNTLLADASGRGPGTTAAPRTV